MTSPTSGARRLLAALAVLLVAAPALAQGRLAFAEPSHAFPPVNEGDVATTTFAFTNSGNTPVTLTEVTPSCGCTTPEYPTGAIAPGASGEIVVAYHSEGRPGPFEKHVTVVAEGADPRVTTLTITGDVVPGFTRTGDTQGAVVFSEGTFVVEHAEGSVQHAFRFQNQGEAPVRINAVRTTAGDAARVVFPERPIFSRDVAGVVVFVDDLSQIARPDGTFDVGVTLETTDPAQPVKSLRLHGTVGGGKVEG